MVDLAAVRGQGAGPGEGLSHFQETGGHRAGVPRHCNIQEQTGHFVAQGSSKLGYGYSPKIILGYGLQDCT